MKRFVLLAAVAAIAAPAALTGCNGAKMNSPFTKKAPASASANYFEIKKDKKTYIVGSSESLKKVQAGEASALSLKEMPNYGPKGETVVFESSSYTDTNRLIAEFRKSKNMP